MTYTLAGVFAVLGILAAAGDTPTLPTTLTLGGVLAVYLGLEVADRRGSHSERDRLRKELADKDAVIAAQDKAVREQLIPLVIEATRVLGDTAKALAIATDRLRRRPS